mgnify:CR=1 FL=1
MKNLDSVLKNGYIKEEEKLAGAMCSNLVKILIINAFIFHS